MKKILLFLALLLAALIGAAQDSTYTRFVGTVQFNSFVADTTAGGNYAGALASFSDQTNLYFASDIQVGEWPLDNLGNRWEVVNITSSNITSAQVNIRALNSPAPGAPFGVGFVSRETATMGLSAFPPDNATGISQQLKSRVETHNTQVVDNWIAALLATPAAKSLIDSLPTGTVIIDANGNVLIIDSLGTARFTAVGSAQGSLVVSGNSSLPSSLSHINGGDTSQVNVQAGSGINLNTTGDISFFNAYSFPTAAPPEDGNGYSPAWTNGTPIWAQTPQDTWLGTRLAQSNVQVVEDNRKLQLQINDGGGDAFTSARAVFNFQAFSASDLGFTSLGTNVSTPSGLDENYFRSISTPTTGDSALISMVVIGPSFLPNPYDSTRFFFSRFDNKWKIQANRVALWSMALDGQMELPLYTSAETFLDNSPEYLLAVSGGKVVQTDTAPLNGSGAPAVPPRRNGDRYFDYTNNRWYSAWDNENGDGTGDGLDADDWIALN